MKIKHIFLITASLLLISHPVKSQLQKQLFEGFIKGKMKDYKIPGLAVLVIKNGTILNKSNYGLTNIEFNIPVSDSTVFQIASVTKIFTSTIIMKLAEDNKLNIDSSVTKYIKDFPASWSDIKIKNLLNHTSGIKNHFQTQKWKEVREDNREKLGLLETILFSEDEPLMFAPGEKWSYSVTGYMILGMIAEKVTGKPFAVLADEILYKPLNMNYTQYGDYKAIIKNRSSLVYTYQNGPFETWNFTYGLSGTTAAGLNTTTTDLAIFFTALDDGKVLKQESINKMMSPTILNDGTVKNYGLGWTVGDYKNEMFYGHEGGGCCWIDYYKDKHLTVVVLCNLTGSKADEIVKGVADFYLAE